MSKFSGKDSAQKEFLKLFDSLTGAHSRWEVWKDMIVIFATTISNAVDRRYWNQREQQYMSTIAKYSHEQQRVFAELFAMKAANLMVCRSAFSRLPMAQSKIEARHRWF